MTTKRKTLIALPLLVGILLGLLAVGLVSARTEVLVDFEGGVPAGWYTYNGGGATIAAATQVVAEGDPLARPGQLGDNTVLESTFDSTVGYAGFGQDFAAGTGPQDWSTYSGVSFWWYGSASGQSYQFEISDNRSDPGSDTAERFDYDLVDDFSGWQKVIIPFADFTRATDYQPGGAPDDGLTLTEMWGWAVVLDGSAGTLYLDDVGLEPVIVDDFENGLPAGVDGDGNAIGFFTFNDANSTVAIATTDAPPAAVPGAMSGNHVLQVDSNVNAGSGFAGVIHAFENEGLDTWTPQDWSSFEGFSFWLYGNNTGSTLFIDILDNRAPGTTGDTAERFSIDIPDDFSGWQFFEIPFADFSRKEVGNGAPNDGFTLTEVHGWAFGVFASGQPFTNYLDDLGLFGIAEIPELAVTFSANAYEVTEGGDAVVTVQLNRPLGQEDDPDQVTVSYSTEDGSATADRDYTPASGTLTFVPDGPSEQTFIVSTVDNNKRDGDKTVILRLSDPAGAALGFIFQSRVDILDDEPFDPTLIDDFERYPYLWHATDNLILANPEIMAGDRLALPNQGAYEGILAAYRRLVNRGLPLDPSDVPSEGRSYEGQTIRAFLPMVHLARSNSEGQSYEGQPIKPGGADTGFGRDFALGRDWSIADGLRFWFFGQNTGDTIALDLLDNRAPDPGPDGWSMVWSDEFDGPAGTPPNPANWTHEIGDGTVNGIPGWGNDELQYYTGGTENVATDGEGNLVITIEEADGSLTCYYGPCEYTSARLISRHKAEFAYGRIEARIKVPVGAGLWPAFWSLGTDIGEVGWPQAGEIDIMEFVGREPFEVFGTIHGPGYSGGASFGGTYTFDHPVSDDYHTFAVEWGPDEIHWFVDGINYHNAVPSDVAPNQWVFNHPFFLIMNVAVGGNFGGPVGPDTVFPQRMLVDYVRVYQGPDTAERFEATFVDAFTGWQEVLIPFDSLARSAQQPEGAPDDGLGLDEVWGYGFRLPDDGRASRRLLLDQVRLIQPAQVTVTNANDSGPGSLRTALAAVAGGGTITFDPSLAGDTILLTSGPLVIDKEVVVDGSGAPGLIISGGGVDRVIVVDPAGVASISHLTIADGYGWQLAGGILNNGSLSLDHCTVTNNVMATDAGDFWQGGGGIYNGTGASLYLVDSTVSDNTAAWSGGGVYGFFDSDTVIERSTISGNVANDVGGAIRMLGNATIVNSTLSGNTSTGWYGGAIFHTDGVMDIVNSTIADNVAPDEAPFAVFVGTFGDAGATLNMTNSIVAENQWAGCFVGYFGPGAVALNSGGHNVASDDTCNLTAPGDQPNTDPMLAPLADNGGPTLTHALTAGSPAIDAADAGVCPATDQRGIARPQGAGCDVGAYESVP